MWSSTPSKLHSQDSTGSSRSWLTIVVKLAVAIALVVYLVKKEHIAWEPLLASMQQWQYSVPALLLLFLTPLGQLWRWQSLLRARQLHLPTGEVFALLMVSKFLNMALPGHIGGDVLRGVFISRRASENSPAGGSNHPPLGPYAVVPSILFDRLFGVSALLVFCLLGTLGTFYHPLPARFVVPFSVLAGCGILATLALLWLAYLRPAPPVILAHWAKKLRMGEMFEELYRGTHDYVRDAALIRKIALISCASQGLILSSLVLYGRALGIEVDLLEYMVLVPVGLVLTTIPITPASLGVGQVAFLALFQLAGSTQGANLFTLYMISQVLINLSGAVLFPLLQTRDVLPDLTRFVRAKKR